MEASISFNNHESRFAVHDIEQLSGSAAENHKPRCLASLIRAQLCSLTRHYGFSIALQERLVEVFELLTRESLDRPAEPPFHGLSYVNADGLPFQWVFRCGSGERGFGFLCEIGVPETSSFERCQLTRARLSEACKLLGLNQLWLGELFDVVLPAKDGQWPTHWRSAMWVGVSASPKGIFLKPYFNLNRGPARERWLRVGNLLKRFNRNHALETLCGLSSIVSAGCIPVGLAVDITAAGSPGRIKIYFRSHEVSPEWLDGWDALEEWNRHRPLLRSGLKYFPLFDRLDFPNGSFTVSLESHPNEQVSLKCDFAVTKWVVSDAQILRGVRAWAADLKQDDEGLRESLISIGAWPTQNPADTVLRFVGIGHEPDGSSHINLYVAPPLVESKSVRQVSARSPESAVVAGCDFLASAQSNGRWTDFELPVGTSDAWVTAYVLAQLATVDRRFWSEELRTRVESGLNWLSSKQRTCGGWGYNESVPPDADSTAWAVLALRLHRHSRAENLDYIKLFERWKSSSTTYATYSSKDAPGIGWATPAPDITAAVLGAASADWDGGMAEAFLRWLQPDGALPAYWWTSEFYSLALLLRWQPTLVGHPIFLRSIARLEHHSPSDSFDAALQLVCLHYSRSERAAEIAETLCDEQLTDGSWSASANLRLTNDAITEPWKESCAGPVYRDNQRVFTTSTVLSALSLHFRSQKPSYT